MKYWLFVFFQTTLYISTSFAQSSIYTEPCKEKIIAYSGGVTTSNFDELVRRCVSISEYNEKQRKKQETINDSQNTRNEADLLIRINRIMKSNGLTDNDLIRCGMNPDPNAVISNHELEEIALCLSLKKK